MAEDFSGLSAFGARAFEAISGLSSLRPTSRSLATPGIVPLKAFISSKRFTEFKVNPKT